jgi:hypothetical protein
MSEVFAFVTPVIDSEATCLLERWHMVNSRGSLAF